MVQTIESQRKLNGQKFTASRGRALDSGKSRQSGSRPDRSDVTLAGESVRKGALYDLLVLDA
jgi:hypothetical protein